MIDLPRRPHSGAHSNSRPRALAAALALCLTAGAARAQELDPQDPALDPIIRGELRLSAEPWRLTGRLHVSYRHAGPGPLAELPLLCYPERLRAPDPALSDRNRVRYIPRAHEPGGQRILGLRDLNGARALSLRRIEASEVPEARRPSPWVPGLYQVVTIRPPLAPGEALRFALDFETDIPRRYGAFGHNQGRLSCEGGITPLLPSLALSAEEEGFGGFDLRAPPRVTRWRLRLESALPGLILGGQRGEEDVAFEGRERLVALAAGERALSITAPATETQPAVEVYGLEPDRAGRIAERARVVHAIWRNQLLALPPGRSVERLVFVEAPLRDRLFLVRGGLVFVSDRLFQLFPLLETFHERELDRALLEALILASPLARREHSDIYWIADGLSFELVPEVPNASAARLDAGALRRFLEVFDVIPTVDQILRAPRFANSELFFGGLIDNPDSIRDDLVRSLSPRGRGRLILHKAISRTGREALLPLTRDLMRPTDRSRAHRLRAWLATEHPDQWPLFFDIWLGAPPLVDLAIEEVEVEGGRVRVVVARIATTEPRLAQLGDPVQVRIDAGDAPATPVWDGRGARGEVSAPKEAWRTRVRLDPEGAHRDLNFSNDISPNLFKLLINRFSVSPDLNGLNANAAAVGLTILPFTRYDLPITLDAFQEREAKGVRLGFGYGFGGQLDQRTYGVVASAGLFAEQLNTGIVSDEGARAARRTGNLADVEGDEDEGDVTGFSLGLRFDTRRDPRSPSQGLRLSLGMDWSDSYWGSDFSYRLYRGSLTAVRSLVPGHAIAAELQASLIEGSEVPLQRLPDIGGEGAVRGIPTGDFLGERALVLRLEYRHLLATEVDVWVPGFAWWRRLEGALFVEAGEVGRRFDIILDNTEDWKVGAGYGLRFHLDFFGVRSTVVRADIAIRIDEPAPVEEEPDRGPFFYLGVDQSF